MLFSSALVILTWIEGVNNEILLFYHKNKYKVQKSRDDNFAVLTTTLLRDVEFLNITGFKLLLTQVRFLRIYQGSSLLLILQSVSSMCIATPKELNNNHT